MFVRRQNQKGRAAIQRARCQEPAPGHAWSAGYRFGRIRARLVPHLPSKAEVTARPPLILKEGVDGWKRLLMSLYAGARPLLVGSLAYLLNRNQNPNHHPAQSQLGELDSGTRTTGLVVQGLMALTNSKWKNPE